MEFKDHDRSVDVGFVKSTVEKFTVDLAIPIQPSRNSLSVSLSRFGYENFIATVIGVEIW